MIQAIPVLRMLKRHRPDSQIYWWLAAELCPLLQGDPDLAGLYPFNRRQWLSVDFWKQMALGLRQMRRQSFHWVIDLQSLARSALVAWFSRGQFTIGLDDSREGARTFYDVTVPRPSLNSHAVDWYLRVLPHLNVPLNWDFDWLPPRPQIAAAVQQKWRPAGAPWIILHPGARWLNKRWPVEYFVELVKRLAATEKSWRFAILGSSNEADLGARIASSLPERCQDLTGQTSLPEMVEWIRFSQLMVTNDTGPMHVAAALGKPVVALFGPTHPSRTGPYHQISQVVHLSLPCEPCLRSRCDYAKPMECLRGLQPAMVAEAVRIRLHETIPPSQLHTPTTTATRSNRSNRFAAC